MIEGGHAFIDCTQRNSVLSCVHVIPLVIKARPDDAFLPLRALPAHHFASLLAMNCFRMPTRCSSAASQLSICGPRLAASGDSLG